MIKLLEWDTNFFGYKIGETQGLPDFDEAISENYKLLYVKSKTPVPKLELRNCFYDHRIIHRKELTKPTEIEDVISLKGSPLTPDLINLAYEAGHVSRYKRDPQFKNDEFKKLYKEWIQNSLSGKMANEVFGYFENEKCLGFITVKIKDTEASIGLLVIDPTAQGRGLATVLTRAAESYAQSCGAKYLFVATQATNTNACRFYIKNGYNEYNEELIYHVWINV